MHAVALNEKALIPTVKNKNKNKNKNTQRNPHILLHSTLKCIIMPAELPMGEAEKS